MPNGARPTQDHTSTTPPPHPRTEHTMLSKRNALGTWLLIGLTLGIYALVMYERLNRELADTLGIARSADGRWWSQLIPVYGIIGIHRTAQRINDVHRAKVISPTATWLFWSWFIVGSYAYLQIGANRAVRHG